MIVQIIGWVSLIIGLFNIIGTIYFLFADKHFSDEFGQKVLLNAALFLIVAAICFK